MRTSKNTSKNAFREIGISLSIITAMRHFSDAQLLCKNNRSASSYLLAIRGMEEVGKALLFLDGADLKKPGSHEKKLKRFFESTFPKLDTDGWAQWFEDEANCARFVDILDLGEYSMWIHPVLKFKNELQLDYLLSGIQEFVLNVFSNDAIKEEYENLDTVCDECTISIGHNCDKSFPKGHVIHEDDLVPKLNNPI